MSGSWSLLASRRTLRLCSALLILEPVDSPNIPKALAHQKPLWGLEAEALPKMSGLELSHRQANGAPGRGCTVFVSATGQELTPSEGLCSVVAAAHNHCCAARGVGGAEALGWCQWPLGLRDQSRSLTWSPMFCRMSTGLQGSFAPGCATC